MRRLVDRIRHWLETVEPFDVEPPSSIAVSAEDQVEDLLRQVVAKDKYIASLEARLVEKQPPPDGSAPVPTPGNVVLTAGVEPPPAALTPLVQHRPPVTAPGRHCPNCAGLEQTVRLLQDERRDLRKQLAAQQLTS